MKVHDVKRIFKNAKKFDFVDIEYETEDQQSWRYCGKLTDFEIINYGLTGYHKYVDIRLIFGGKEFFAYGLEKFAEDFIGFIGTGFENQFVYLRIIPQAKNNG